MFSGWWAIACIATCIATLMICTTSVVPRMTSGLRPMVANVLAMISPMEIEPECASAMNFSPVIKAFGQ